MGALWASAEEVDGEWCPNFYAVARSMGLTHPVVIRWWGERDVSGDEHSRSIAIRAREAAYADGGRLWARRMLAMVQARCAELLTEARMADADVDEAARALRNVTETVIAVDAHLGTPPDSIAPAGDGDADSVDVTARIRVALARAGNGGRPEGGDGGPVPG